MTSVALYGGGDVAISLRWCNAHARSDHGLRVTSRLG